MFAPIISAATPVIREGAKEGCKAIVSMVTVSGGLAAIAAGGYGLYRGGRWLADQASDLTENLFGKTEHHHHLTIILPDHSVSGEVSGPASAEQV